MGCQSDDKNGWSHEQMEACTYWCGKALITLLLTSTLAPLADPQLSNYPSEEERKRKKQANIWSQHTSWEEKWSPKSFRDRCLCCTCQPQTAGVFSAGSSSSSSSSPFVWIHIHWSSFQRNLTYFQNHWRTFLNCCCSPPPPRSRCLILHKHAHRKHRIRIESESFLYVGILNLKKCTTAAAAALAATATAVRPFFFLILFVRVEFVFRFGFFALSNQRCPFLHLHSHRGGSREVNLTKKKLN